MVPRRILGWKVPPRPVPTVKGGDVSGKSISGKSGRSNVIVETGKSGKVPAHVSRSEPTKAPLDLDESTEARVPALALAHQQERNGPPQGLGAGELYHLPRWSRRSRCLQALFHRSQRMP